MQHWDELSLAQYLAKQYSFFDYNFERILYTYTYTLNVYLYFEHHSLPW